MERPTIAPEEDYLLSDDDDKYDEEIMRMFGSNTGITLKVKGNESTQTEGDGKGGEGGGGDGEGEEESEGEGNGNGEGDGEGEESVGEGEGDGKGGDESTPVSGAGVGGAAERDGEADGEADADGEMEEEASATLEKDIVAVGGEQVVGDNEGQAEKESEEEASGALLAMSETGNETPVESDDGFPYEEEAVTGKGFTLVDTNESEGVGGIFMLSKVAPEHVSEKLSTIQTRAGGSCLDLEIQPGFREPFGTFTDSESEEETKKKKRIPTGKTIVKKRRPKAKPTGKKEDSDSESVVELDEVERPPAKKKSAVVLQNKVGGSTEKLHKEIQKKARRTGKLPKEKDEEGVLPGVDERPKLTEEEVALVDTVVRYTKKHLCNGKGSQSTFGGSLGRVLRRKHPVIYLHDIPLDKNFAKAFHSTFNKEYLDAIVARSSVQEKREGDKGNGRCILNRIKSSSEADLHAFIRKELG